MRNFNTLTHVGVDVELTGVPSTFEVSCNTCIGACCKSNTAIPLNKKEAAFLRSAGTAMRRMTKDENNGNRPGWRRDFYKLESDCGNLNPTTGQCEAYEERPVICREFVVGSTACEAMRERAGVVELPMPKFERTE